MKTAAYAGAPGILGSLCGLLPVLGGLLSLAAMLYGVYVLRLGLPVTMRSADDKAWAYTAAVVVCGLLLGVLLAGVNYVTGGLGLGGPTLDINSISH